MRFAPDLLDAHSVGVAPSSIYKRRATDPGFAAAMTAALDLATATLECALLEADEATPFPAISMHEALWLLRMHKHGGARRPPRRAAPSTPASASPTRT